MKQLTVDGLNAFYGSSHVLHGVSLSVSAGEAVALVGRNGAGKSTTLHSICGIQRQVSGSVMLDAANILGRPAHQISRLGLGFVPETRRVFGDLTVIENLRVGARLDPSGGGWSVEDVIDFFPLLRPLLRRTARDLSGGEQQVLAIARALVANPQVLLLDEPTEGLAPRIIESLAEQLADIRRLGVTMLLSEQHLPFAVSLTDRTYIIDQGQIRFECASDELTSNAAVLNAFLAV